MITDEGLGFQSSETLALGGIHYHLWYMKGEANFEDITSRHLGLDNVRDLGSDNMGRKYLFNMLKRKLLW